MEWMVLSYVMLGPGSSCTRGRQKADCNAIKSIHIEWYAKVLITSLCSTPEWRTMQPGWTSRHSGQDRLQGSNGHERPLEDCTQRYWKRIPGWPSSGEPIKSYFQNPHCTSEATQNFALRSWRLLLVLAIKVRKLQFVKSGSSQDHHCCIAICIQHLWTQLHCHVSEKAVSLKSMLPGFSCGTHLNCQFASTPWDHCALASLPQELVEPDSLRDQVAREIYSLQSHLARSQATLEAIVSIPFTSPIGNALCMMITTADLRREPLGMVSPQNYYSYTELWRFSCNIPFVHNVHIQYN